jgi:hypothetical protein
MIITVKKVPFNDDAIAATIGPIVFVEKGAVDKGVVEHEKFHARMFYCWNAPTAILALVAWFIGCISAWYAIPLAFAGFALRAAAYNFIKAYRLWEETRAYGIQAAVNNYSTEKTKSYAKILLDHYTKGDYSQADITDLEEKLIDERANYS